MIPKAQRQWPLDYPGGPLGQSAIWAIVIVLLVIAFGSFIHG